jgi:hypothetical protein
MIHCKKWIDHITTSAFVTIPSGEIEQPVLLILFVRTGHGHKSIENYSMFSHLLFSDSNSLGSIH